MIALDTNVLVRYLVADDPRQAAAAQRLVEGSCIEATWTFERRAARSPLFRLVSA